MLVDDHRPVQRVTRRREPEQGLVQSSTQQIEPDDAACWAQRQRLWLHWHVEGATEPYTTVLHPLPG